MKILLVTHHWHTHSHHSKSSGYERLTYYLAKLHQVDVLTWGKRNSFKKQDDLLIIFRKTPPTNFLFEKRLILSFQAFKIAKNYDLVHCLYSDPGMILNLKFPTVITEHNLPEIDPTLWTKYKSIIQRPTLKRAKLIIAVSRNLEKIIKTKYNSKTIFIPHGIDIKSFHPIKANQAQKKKFLKNKYHFISFSCGIQGINSKVFQQVAKKFPEVLFVVVGRKETTGEAKNIYHPGKISEKRLKEFYTMADFCFKPLGFATANNAILEAMAMGKVNITNKIPGITDYLNDNCAYLARVNEDFCDLFKRAMENKEERERKGKMARKRAEKYFSWEIIAKKISKLYKKILAESTRKKYVQQPNC